MPRTELNRQLLEIYGAQLRDGTISKDEFVALSHVLNFPTIQDYLDFMVGIAALEIPPENVRLLIDTMLVSLDDNERHPLFYYFMAYEKILNNFTLSQNRRDALSGFPDKLDSRSQLLRKAITLELPELQLPEIPKLEVAEGYRTYSRFKIILNWELEITSPLLPDEVVEDIYKLMRVAEKLPRRHHELAKLCVWFTAQLLHGDIPTKSYLEFANHIKAETTADSKYKAELKFAALMIAIGTGLVLAGILTLGTSAVIAAPALIGGSSVTLGTLWAGSDSLHGFWKEKSRNAVSHTMADIGKKLTK